MGSYWVWNEANRVGFQRIFYFFIAIFLLLWCYFNLLIPLSCMVSWMMERAGVSDDIKKSSTCFLTRRHLLYIPFTRGSSQSQGALFLPNVWNLSNLEWWYLFLQKIKIGLKALRATPSPSKWSCHTTKLLMITFRGKHIFSRNTVALSKRFGKGGKRHQLKQTQTNAMKPLHGLAQNIQKN